MKKSLLTILCTLLSVFSWAQGTAAGDGSAEPYAVLTDNQDIISQDATGITYGKTLTFYYDTNKSAYNGAIALAELRTNETVIEARRSTITNVTFDSSFANYRPTSTASWFAEFLVLTSITGIENLVTNDVTSMAGMFMQCSNLTSIDLSNFNTANVTDMSWMFSTCSGLTNLNVGSFTTDKVLSMERMFYECSGLSSLDVSNFNTSNVTDMRYMFWHCSGLTSLDVTNFSTANVTTMRYMFSGCSGLTSLDLSSFNTAKVTDMTSMLSECSNLTKIYIGSQWSTAAVTEGNRMFTDCTSLVGGAGTAFDASHVDYTYAHIDGGTANPGYFTDKNAPTSYIITVTSYGNGQVSVEGVSEVVEDGKKAEVAVTAGGSLEMFFFPGEGYQLDSLMVDGVNVTADVVPATEQSAASYTLNNINAVHNVITFFGEKASYNEAYAVLVSEDGGNIMYATLYYDGNKASHTEGFAVVGLDEMLQNQAWMMNRGNIKTVNFDESFANCNPTSTAYWFAFCNSLTAINGLQYLNTEFVTNMEYMFHMCPALTSIDLSHFRAKSLTNMNSMFGGCSSLTSLDLSGFFTFTVTNMNYLFSGCTNLKTIYVNKYDWSTESVTAGDGVFENCTSLVGGAGTTFNDSHIDYTYARIDGGPDSQTPGYFTDIDASASVVAPEFRFEGDNLAMTTETQNASIFYKVAELPSMDEAVVDSVRNSLVVTPDGQQSTYYEHPFELKMAAVVKAIAVADNATGTIVSDTTTMVYDYQAWVNLKAAVSSGTDLYGRAQGNPNVDTQLLEQLQWALNEGDMIYNNRAQMDSFEATHFTQRINELCAQIEAQMAEDEPYAVLSDNNTVLTFYYDKQKTARGGIDINTRSWDIENGETPPYGGITKAVFDASFANYRPTRTDYWFQGCRNMTTVEGMENLNTSNVTSMWAMFDWCGSLESIDLSHMVTSNAVYLAYMFNGCSSLRSLDVSGFSTEKATDIGAMFRYCSKLTTVDVSHFNTSKVTSFWGLFAECSSLTSLDVSNFNTGQAENMAYMFYDCNQLQSLNVSNFNTSNVTDMLGMFGGCSSLTSLDLSSFNTQNVTNMTAMFYGCSGLTSLNLSGFNTSNVTDMQNMFSGRDMYSACRSLTSLDLSSFNTEKVTDMHAMFYSCSNLTTLDLTNFTTPKVRDFTNMFIGCEALETIYCENNWDSSSLDDQGTSNKMFYGLTKLKGGAGTTYSDEHTGPEYARVDGGPNSTTPGYFTDKDATASVVAPEFRFEGDNLAMTTETQNASIFYKVAELPSMDEAVVDSVRNSLVVTPDGQQSTYYEHPFELKMAAVVKAIAVADNATGTIVSDTTTMVYDYEAWVNLKAAVTSGVDLYGRAQGNPNVDTQLLEDLQWALNEGDMIYNNRAQMDSFEAIHFTQRINELCAQIEAQMTPTGTVATPNFSWQNDELTISTTTEGADIYYWLSDVDVNGDGVITDADYAHYNNPLTIQRDVTIKAYAAKQAMDNSEIRTLDYPYTSWQTLREVISYASSVADRARHSAKVPDQEVASFEEDIAASYDMYEHRTETKDRVEEVARYLSERAYEIERMMEVEATFVDGVLTIEGNTTVAEALESFGVSTVTESIAAIVYNSSVPMANSDLQAITNPNLLIYVKSDSLAPADRNNIIVDGFAKNIVLTDVAQGNNDFYCPQSFTAEAISYTREFKQKTQIGVSRGWETIALPFTVQTIMHETRGLITPFGNNRSNTHFWLRRLTHDGLQSDSIIEANTAYLISMPNSEEYIAEYNLAGRVTFSAANVTVPVTEIIMDESANYMMAPVFQRLAAQNNLYVLNVGEERSGYPEGSIFESNYRAVLPFQAYVEHKGSNPAPPYFIVGDLGGDTTGIDATLVNSERVNSEAWYTLDGRKLQGKPTQKGVYITNGKKVIIK